MATPKTIVDIIGSYRISAASGLTTTIAAATATAGHLFSWRWGDTTGVVGILKRLEITYLVTTGYTVAQEVGFDVVKATAYTASHTGAAAVTLTTTNTKTSTAHPVTKLTSARIADTGALTAGTHTFDAALLARDSMHALAATAGGGLIRQYDFSHLEAGGYVFIRDEGFVVRNVILGGAAGSGRWAIDVEWDEGVVV